MDEDNYYDYDEWIERVEMFADPGGYLADISVIDAQILTKDLVFHVEN
jgi:hypothetical protein